MCIVDYITGRCDATLLISMATIREQYATNAQRTELCCAWAAIKTHIFTGVFRYFIDERLRILHTPEASYVRPTYSSWEYHEVEVSHNTTWYMLSVYHPAAHPRYPKVPAQFLHVVVIFRLQHVSHIHTRPCIYTFTHIYRDIQCPRTHTMTHAIYICLHMCTCAYVHMVYVACAMIR